MVSPLDLGSLHTRDLQTAVFLTCKAEIPHSLHHCSLLNISSSSVTPLPSIARFFLNTRVTRLQITSWSVAQTEVRCSREWGKLEGGESGI